ncbi:hypothetical protein C0995_012190, partial [Termitomyces sp. Mi166
AETNAAVLFAYALNTGAFATVQRASSTSRCPMEVCYCTTVEATPIAPLQPPPLAIMSQSTKQDFPSSSPKIQ